jgi:transcriptional regulator with XRE-family HTH domain
MEDIKEKTADEKIKEVKIIFGKKLQILMIRKGKRKSDLSKETNIPYTNISDWCSGKVYPKLQNIVLLAEYFNVKYDDLVKTSEWEKF